MDIIKWRETYETGIEQMDSQHKQLIQLVNQLYGIIRDKKGFEAVDTILGQMEQYATNHLHDEEKLLEEHAYPGLAAQQQSHQSYFATMEQLLGARAGDRQAAAQAIYIFLRQWWLNHIVQEDRDYGEYLRKKGLS